MENYAKKNIVKRALERSNNPGNLRTIQPCQWFILEDWILSNKIPLRIALTALEQNNWDFGFKEPTKFE